MGISLIELDTSQLNCQNKLLNSKDTLLNLIQRRILEAGNQSSFTSNFWLRTFTSGCYFMDTNTNYWSSYGMEILEDTNLTHTHCISNHLTTFAGGFIVLPNAIDFNYVWSHSSFLQNPVIYSTVIILISLYVMLGLWARWMDVKDKKKCNITLLGNIKEHMRNRNKYIYEIITFTGNRLNAGTKSKVFKYLN